jgi:hypothetical protein
VFSGTSGRCKIRKTPASAYGKNTKRTFIMLPICIAAKDVAKHPLDLHYREYGHKEEV